jgi:medium-chain acyl-[acyl-carrier-protein] hydrolase
MTPVPAVWEEQRIVESFEVDMRGRLKPPVLFAWLLNSAWNHARELDFGFQAFSARGLLWVLSKLQLSFGTMPSWDERVMIETWGKGIEKLYALRDFAVRSPGGEKICTGTSAWLILHAGTHRPQKPDVLMKDFSWSPERSELDTSLTKLPELSHAAHVGEFLVTYSDIDVNSHVTSARYLQWMLDSFPPEVLTGQELATVEISFLSEAVLGDHVTVSREEGGDANLCSIRRTGDGKELCRARIGWRAQGFLAGGGGSP